MTDLSRSAREARTVLAHYGPLSVEDLAELMGWGYTRAHRMLSVLASEGEARQVGTRYEAGRQSEAAPS